MNGEMMQGIREKMGMERLQFARTIGYTGTDRNDENRIMWFETDSKQIPLYIARFVVVLWHLYKDAKIALAQEDIELPPWMDPITCLPKFPLWAGYEYISEPDPGHVTKVRP